MPDYRVVQLSETLKQVSTGHTPNLNRRSLKLAKESQSGTFLQRVAKDALKKEHKAMQIKAANALDPECTFAPQINEKSKELAPRSVVELSRGDMLKRESAQRLMRLKSEQVCRGRDSESVCNQRSGFGVSAVCDARLTGFRTVWFADWLTGG